MIRALYSAASGMLAQQVNIDTISNNLANVNTTGFKKGRAEFQELLYAQIRPPINSEAVAISVGQGSRLSSIQRIFAGGTMQATGNTFDIAIQGDGFFQVLRADGSIAYTRDGAFRLDSERRLVTAAGDWVLGENDEPLVIPQSAVNTEIGADGTVRYTDTSDPSGNTTAVVGRISLALFPNPAGLFSEGENLFRSSDASGAPFVVLPGDKDVGRLAQGFLEASNVQVVEEMVNLITAQRAYEINSKAIQSADDMMGIANNLRRG